jgi:PAS domain S-box-containing protein
VDGTSTQPRSTDRESALVALLHAVTRAANETDDILDAGRAALDAVCRFTGWPVGHLAVPAGDGTDDYVSSGIWEIADGREYRALREVTAGIRCSPDAGLSGVVRTTGRPASIDDLRTDPRFIRSRSGRDLEVVSAFAFPVLAAGGVAAVLEFFSTTPASPDTTLLDVMADVGTQLGRVVDRVEARRALEASKRHVEQVIETAVEAFVSMDDQGLITDWNAAAERMFGLSRGQAVGRLLGETIVPPRFREAHARGVDRFLRTGERRVLDRRIEINAWHRSGREFPVELSIWGTNENGRWTFTASLHDVSERRRADGERDRLLAEQQLLLQSATHGIYRLDRDGRCAFANPAAAHLLGWPLEQLVGSRVHALIHRHDERHHCPVEVAIRTQQPVQVENEMLWRADGTSFPAEYTCSPVINDGEFDGLVVSFTDISQRHQAERSLRQAYEHERTALAKLKELDDAKTNFLATVSHELRTPLTSLAGYLELFSEGDVGPVTDAQRRVLGTMARNADRLRSLIEDLLTVSHVEARPLALSPVDVEVATLVNQAVSVLSDAAKGRDHELTIDVEDGLGPVRVDPAQFRRVLTSLIDNAVKCTPPGGRIVVGARASGDGGVEFAIHDNGIGIDEAELPRLFTRFFRTSAATQLAIQGAGLSLAIARQIVDGHGGAIDVETRPGEGATFTVRVPG